MHADLLATVHGVGFWKDILMSDVESFPGRTHINLKDKWRTMCTKRPSEVAHQGEDKR
ncbi:hypothetical protein ACP70R_016946 [Stipagrostis hirtigluma subsp. patula]